MTSFPLSEATAIFTDLGLAYSYFIALSKAALRIILPIDSCLISILVLEVSRCFNTRRIPSPLLTHIFCPKSYDWALALASKTMSSSSSPGPPDVKSICSWCSTNSFPPSAVDSVALSPAVEAPGDVARDVVLDAAVEKGAKVLVAVLGGPPNANPNPTLGDFAGVVLKMPEVGLAGVSFAVFAGGDPNKPPNDDLDGDGEVTWTPGALLEAPNLIGVSGFQVWSPGEGLPESTSLSAGVDEDCWPKKLEVRLDWVAEPKMFVAGLDEEA